MTQRPYRFLDIVIALFVTTLIVSNIASSAKIVDWGIRLFGLRLAFDAGTILVLASLLGYWSGEFANSLVGQLVDTGVFVAVASLAGVDSSCCFYYHTSQP